MRRWQSNDLASEGRPTTVGSVGRWWPHISRQFIHIISNVNFYIVWHIVSCCSTGPHPFSLRAMLQFSLEEACSSYKTWTIWVRIGGNCAFCAILVSTPVSNESSKCAWWWALSHIVPCTP